MNTLPEFLSPTKSVTSLNRQLSGQFHGYQPLLASWLLNMTLSLGLYKKSNRRSIIEDEDFSVVTGLEMEKLISDDDEEMQLIVNGRIKKHSDSECRAILRTKLAAFKKMPVRDDLTIFKNIETIGKLLGLNRAEQAVLCFVTMLDVFTRFKGALAATNLNVSVSKLGVLISHLTGNSESEIIDALRQESKLVVAGILEVSTHDELSHRLDLLNGLGVSLAQKYENDNDLINRFLKKASPASLRLNSFPHLSQDICTLTSFLGNSLKLRSIGTNILLYGIPGTGKTELVKALASELGVDLFEITYSDSDGNPITGNARLRAYNLCQLILANKGNALLMFDEIEDVFQIQGGMRSLFGIETPEPGGRNAKAWINRTLERNTTPTIWITNSANIDEAYLRRYDYSIRFSVPPQKVRKEIARHHLGQFDPSEEWLEKISANEQTTPAQYERAAKVARITGCDNETAARQLVEQVLDRSATLLGQKRLPHRNILHTGYDLGFVNTSVDMRSLMCGLMKKRQGTFCFYGPAGTGKSELARHIADELGMSCLVHRASDILSMWVGESEKNIAAMFAEARQQDTLLVLDEADSFLADRRGAHQSWEVTQVNELLTQIEAFNGIFVCTTNLMDRLDQASLRRFAFKVQFDYLNPDQRWQMFTQELIRLGGDAESATLWEKPVRDLAKLTPGDFAVAARQFSILDLPVTASELYRQLMEECKVKGGATGKIGFVS